MAGAGSRERARTQCHVGSIDANGRDTNAHFAITGLFDFNLYDSEHLRSSDLMDANTADHVIRPLCALCVPQRFEPLLLAGGVIVHIYVAHPMVGCEHPAEADRLILPP
jgi:hypothetical protein